MDENLTERYGKALGIRGAWNEGWASYFSMASQEYYDYRNTDISNILNVADLKYTNITLSNGSYFESFQSDLDYETNTGFGEGNEAAVTSALLKFVLNGVVTDQELWNIAKSSECQTFSEFMSELLSSVNKYKKLDIGEILEYHKFTDKPDVETLIFSRTTPGVFRWLYVNKRDAHNESGFNLHGYSYVSRINIYDSSLQFITQTSAYSSTHGQVGYTIDAETWQRVMASTTEFYWCVVTSQVSNEPITGPYISSFHKGYFDDTVIEINQLNQPDTRWLTQTKDRIFEFTPQETSYYTFFSSGSTNVCCKIYEENEYSAPVSDDTSHNYSYTKIGYNFTLTHFLYSQKTYYIVVYGNSINTTGNFSLTVQKDT